ncbi:hypothetical protein [Nocardia sp. Marseille-Q1738]
MNDEPLEITEKGRALIESGLSTRHLHELETGCTAERLCERCVRDALVSAESMIAARDARITELEAQRDRVTDLFEKWAAEESEHRAAGEYGIAEGLHVAIEELRQAVHGAGETR